MNAIIFEKERSQGMQQENERRERRTGRGEEALLPFLRTCSKTDMVALCAKLVYTQPLQIADLFPSASGPLE